MPRREHPGLRGGGRRRDAEYAEELAPAQDHEAFVMFQRYFADAETYAALATLRAVMEGVASDPKRAFRKVVG